MIFIDSDFIENAASYDEWINCMERAFLENPASDYIMPLRTHINFSENTLLLMPCIKKDYFATKIVSLFPGNSKIGKKPLSGLVVLNDGSTGEPVAVIDASKLTAMRTAAVGSVAVRHLAPGDATTLGIIGLGTQGIHQALFACSQRKFSKIYILDLYPGLYPGFIEKINSIYPGIEIIIASSSSHLCKESEVIITATNSTTPVLPAESDLLINRTIIGVGSYKPDMREFPDILFPLAKYIYVDTLHGLKESGDLKYPLESGAIKEENFITADRLVRGSSERGLANVFKSVGMALFDLFSAILVYEKYGVAKGQNQHPVS